MQTVTPSDADQFIIIPGEPTFRKSVVPPAVVQLPVTAYVNRRMTIVVGAVWTFVALIMAIAALTLFLGTPQIHRTLFEDMALTLFGLFALGLVPLASAAALFSFQDARSNEPVLTIDKQGLIDHRSGLSVRWMDVVSARPIHNWGVTLQMRDRSLLPRSSRLGYPLLIWRKPCEVHVQSKFLSTPEYEIVNSVFGLVCLGGGRVLPSRLFRLL